MNALWLILPWLANAPVYDAATTYEKLRKAYPHIAIADAAITAPASRKAGLVYALRGEIELGLDLYLPAPSTQAAPLVVLVHGGGWRSGDRSNMAPLAARLAARGYAAATVSYRLSGQARYPAAIHDVRDAMAWLRTQGGRYGFDPAKVAVAGGSAGGQIAALAGMTGKDIKAVINIDGLSDFTSQEALKHEDDPAKNPSAAGAWFGGRYAEKSAIWRDASPLYHVDRDSPPVLFIVSSETRFSVGREAMAARLGEYGIHSETVALPGTPHSFWLFNPWIDPTADAIDSFLSRVFQRSRP